MSRATGARRSGGEGLLPAAAPLLGGPLGQRASARARSLGRLLPVLTGLVVLPMTAAVLRQGHCIAKGWGGDDQLWRGCYSDLTAQYQLAGLAAGLPGWLDGSSATAQPPLIAALLTAVGALVPGGPVLAQTRWYLLLWVLLLTVAAALLVRLALQLRASRPDLAVQLALTPAYVVAGLLSADLVVVLVVVAALVAWSRQRPVLSGLLLGLAILGHAWVLLVVAAGVLAAHRQGRLGQARRMAGVALLTAGGAAVLLALVRPALVTGPVRAWWVEPAGYGALVKVPELLGRALPVAAVTTIALVGWGLALVAAAAMSLRSWQAPDWVQVAAFGLPVLVLLGRSVPVQALLWVLPLAILAGVSWRTHLAVVLVEALHATALWLYLGHATDPDKGLPPQWYAVTILARAMAWGFLLWSVWYTPAEPDGADAVPAPLDGLPVRPQGT